MQLVEDYGNGYFNVESLTQKLGIIFLGDKQNAKKALMSKKAKENFKFNDYLYGLRRNCHEKWNNFLRSGGLPSRCAPSALRQLPNALNSRLYNAYLVAKKVYKPSLEASKR